MVQILIALGALRWTSIRRCCSRSLRAFSSFWALSTSSVKARNARDPALAADRSRWPRAYALRLCLRAAAGRALSAADGDCGSSVLGQLGRDPAVDADHLS